jgi:hypothetical protein
MSRHLVVQMLLVGWGIVRGQCFPKCAWMAPLRPQVAIPFIQGWLDSNSLQLVRDDRSTWHQLG